MFALTMTMNFLIQKEKFEIKEYNSSNIPLSGKMNQENKEQDKLKTIPTKQFIFKSDSLFPSLTTQETQFIEIFLKQHFPKFLSIEKIKKEQQNYVKRYDIVFLISDSSGDRNHIILTKIIFSNNHMFFNTLEYGGMVFPNELPSTDKNDNYFFINQSSNKITLLDQQINQELDKFEKRKIEILLRRGRKAS